VVSVSMVGPVPPTVISFCITSWMVLNGVVCQASETAVSCDRLPIQLNLVSSKWTPLGLVIFEVSTPRCTVPNTVPSLAEML